MKRVVFKRWHIVFAAIACCTAASAANALCAAPSTFTGRWNSLWYYPNRPPERVKLYLRMEPDGVKGSTSSRFVRTRYVRPGDQTRVAGRWDLIGPGSLGGCTSGNIFMFFDRARGTITGRWSTCYEPPNRPFRAESDAACGDM